MFGGLHIEMTAFKALGQWLENSGWTAALVESGIITSGRADSLLNASHIRRTRRFHEITAVALHVLQRKAYDRYLESSQDILEYEIWSAQQASKHPQFKF